MSPDEMVERYGADATRMYSLFAAPPDRDLDWQETGLKEFSGFWACVSLLPQKSRKTRLAETPATETGPLSPEARAIHAIAPDHQTREPRFPGRWHFNTCIAALWNC